MLTGIQGQLNDESRHRKEDNERIHTNMGESDKRLLQPDMGRGGEGAGDATAAERHSGALRSHHMVSAFAPNKPRADKGKRSRLFIASMDSERAFCLEPFAGTYVARGLRVCWKHYQRERWSCSSKG